MIRSFKSDVEHSKDLNKPDGFDRLICFSGSWLQTMKELNKLGLSKVLLLGGSEMVASFFYEDLIDEIQLTLVPKVIRKNDE